jgi:hypothetical protein
MNNPGSLYGGSDQIRKLRRDIISGLESIEKGVLINKKNCSFFTRKVNSNKKVIATIEKSREPMRVIITLGLVKN